MSRPILLAVSHGTSDAEGARAIADLVDAVAAALPDVEVRSAFVDVQQPDAADLLPTIEGPVVIVPLLLSRGFHVHHDLHGMAAKKPDAVVSDAMGPDPRLAEVLADRLAAAGAASATSADAARLEPVILAVAGSRDPASVTDAEAMASLLSLRLGAKVELAYLAARQPDLPSSIAAHPDAVVSTYLLAQGFFFDLTISQTAGRSVTAPLLDGVTVPQPLIDLVIARYDEAAARLPATAARS
ncbi:CbiX/SirB N-terminal domain-containing protein [Microbacterium sp. CFBP9023]|uniref:sirohydrochlorin chelatase n=1 Tax=Microbacterium sp. CFBP9023 TaxID=3096535 RepID=UPI002A69B151|nr:CbiX/SirB N-terminal domain-containing protein [Microbacterium sp. CFBP9023]MDY0983550.1 CbiX/SirB N-terminal domain-containing protein [Microbacterium sp. CFBP9023]